MTEEYREVDIPLVRLTRPYRTQLEAQMERLEEQHEALEKQLDDVYDKAQPSLDALAAKVPELGDLPTAVELLTRRVAIAELDVAIYTRDVSAAEARVGHTKVVADRDNLQLRIGQVDHVAEADDPVLSPGNDDQLAIWTLTAQESGLELATAEASLQFARRRLEHAKKARRAVQDALRRTKRDERSAGT